MLQWLTHVHIVSHQNNNKQQWTMQLYGQSSSLLWVQWTNSDGQCSGICVSLQHGHLCIINHHTHSHLSLNIKEDAGHPVRWQMAAHTLVISMHVWVDSPRLTSIIYHQQQSASLIVFNVIKMIKIKNLVKKFRELLLPEHWFLFNWMWKNTKF